MLSHRRNAFLCILFLAVMLMGFNSTLAEKKSVSGTVYASTLADNAEIVLTGNTTLVMDVDRSLKDISGDFALTIRGEKTLSMRKAGRLINVASLTVSAPLDLVGGNNTAIYANSGSVTVNSNVRISAVSGIWAKKNITFAGGTSWVEAGLIAIKAEEGTVTIRTTVSAYSIDSDVINAYGDVLIESPAQVTAITSGKTGIYSKYGNITVTGGIVSTHGHRGIYAENGNVSLAGTVLALSGNSPAIYAIKGSVTIQSGRTFVQGVTGIWAQKDVNIRGGSVEIDSSICGIVSDTGSVSISGDVKAYSPHNVKR